MKSCGRHEADAALLKTAAMLRRAVKRLWPAALSVCLLALLALPIAASGGVHGTHLTISEIPNDTTPPAAALPPRLPYNDGIGIEDIAEQGQAYQSSTLGSMFAFKAIRGLRSSHGGFEGAGDYAHTALRILIKPLWQVTLQTDSTVHQINVYKRG